MTRDSCEVAPDERVLTKSVPHSPRLRQSFDKRPERCRIAQHLSDRHAIFADLHKTLMDGLQTKPSLSA
jgi:hypothetical protein